MERTRVSVCLATYNGEKYIYEQLASILKQIDKNDEVIISDDGSTDSTLAIIENFKDSRIQVVSHTYSVVENNYEGRLKRIFLNFKNSILHSSGEIIFISDQDDIWVDSKYDSVLQEFKNTDKKLVIHNAFILSQHYTEGTNFFSLFPKSMHNWGWILKNNPFLGCCMALRKEIAATAFQNNSIVIPHDTWIALIASYRYHNAIHIINTPLIHYRVHDSNNSFFLKSSNSLFFKLKYRIKLLYHLLRVKV